LINPFTSKYCVDNLEASLKKILPIKVSECQKNFVVPSFSLKSVSPVIFHNFDESYNHMKIWKIARSTSAAPMFYLPFSENILIDGGIL
jgi:patatin-like phospholipase/acyl hydrolase